MKETLNFVKITSIFLITLILIIYIYANLSFNFLSPESETGWIHRYIEYKDQIAISKESPKILILAGSNALYGISAKQIEEELQIPSVNFATTSTLRDYIFEKAKRVLKSGDIVYMPLEYGYYWEYTNKNIFETQDMRAKYIYKRDIYFYQSRPLIDKISINLIGFKDLFRNIKNNEIIPSYDPINETVNEWGDTTNNKEREDFEIIQVNFPNNFNHRFGSNLGYPLEKNILDFAIWCKENNITLIASYPSALYLEVYDTNSYKESFKSIGDFYLKNNIITLGIPSDFFYQENLFYNTDYHLNFEGRKIRTDFIIRELKVLLNIHRTDLFPIE